MKEKSFSRSVRVVALRMDVYFSSKTLFKSDNPAFCIMSVAGEPSVRVKPSQDFWAKNKAVLRNSEPRLR